MMPFIAETKQNSHHRLRAFLKDLDGLPIPGSEIDTLTLTLYDKATRAIINARDAQDVLQKNGVTVSEAGELIWMASPEDNPILSTTLLMERHVVLFEYSWGGDPDQTDHVKIYLDVQRMERPT